MPPPQTPGPQTPARNYCRVLDPGKYDRNRLCRLHDNAYGVNGGGGRAERLRADRALLAGMRGRGDPMALPAFLACRLLGWFFFNYRRGPWRGQLVRRFAAAPR